MARPSGKQFPWRCHSRHDKPMKARSNGHLHAYDSAVGVSATLALAVGALVVGAIAGCLITRLRRQHAEHPPSVPTVAELLLRLVRSSNNGVVVLNRFGDMVLYNPRAEALGLVRENRADTRARLAAEQVVETDETV